MTKLPENRDPANQETTGPGTSAEEMPRNQENHWRLLVDTLPDYVALYDRDRRYIFLNHYAVGFSKQDIAGKPYSDFLPKEACRAYDEAFERAHRTGVPQRIEHSAFGDRRELRLYESTIVPIPDEGQAATTMVVARDITDLKRAELALRESEHAYRLLFENALIGISQALPDGPIVRANQAYAEMYGYADPAQMLAEVTDVRQLYANPEDRAEVLQILSEKGVMEPREFSLIRRDGSRFVALVSARALRDVTGNLVCLQAEHVDITERMRAEEAFRRSEQKFRSMTEQTSDLIALTDPSGVITYASPSARALFGCAPQEMCGRQFNEFLDERDRPKAIEAFRAALERDAPTNNLALTMKRKDGSLFVGELSGSSFRDAAEAGSLVLIRDITERKRAEEALHETNERLRALIEGMPDLVLVLDEDGRYVEVHAQDENLLYKEAAELKGRLMHEVFDASVADRFLKAVRDTIESGTPQVIEYELPVPSGLRHFEGRTVPMDLVIGGRKVVLFVARDITGRTQAEDKVKTQLDDLKRWQQAMLGRESRVLELKREVNELLAKAGQPPRYDSVLPKDT